MLCIKNLILKSKDSIFPDLGSIVSFFTSLNESHSVGITIHIGNANPRFINSIVLDPIILNSYNGTEDYGISYDNLACIFKELIIIFKPFYGCVASSHNLSLYDNNFVNSLLLCDLVRYDIEDLEFDLASAKASLDRLQPYPILYTRMSDTLLEVRNNS